MARNMGLIWRFGLCNKALSLHRAQSRLAGIQPFNAETEQQETSSARAVEYIFAQTIHCKKR